MKVVIEVPEYLRKLCRDFAADSEPSSASTWNSSRAKRLNDIYVGKVGECAAFLHLEALGHDVLPPDFAVYIGSQKSFDADLTCDDYRIHCKTQSAASMAKYGISWILQYDERRRDPLFSRRDRNDIFVGMTATDDGVVEIQAICRVMDLFSGGAVLEPAIEWLRATKRAIYFREIQKFTPAKRWRTL